MLRIGKSRNPVSLWDFNAVLGCDSQAAGVCPNALHDRVFHNRTPMIAPTAIPKFS